MIPAITYFGGGYCSSDPYQIYDISTGIVNLSTGNYNISGRTQTYSALNSSETSCVIIAIGQSNIANSVNAIYAVTQARNNTFCVYNGATYVSSEPLLGCNTSPADSGNWITQLADRLITVGSYSRVILVPIGIGGTIVADWASSVGTLGQRIPVTARRMASVGLRATHIIWHQGESDTTAATTQASYTNSLASVIASFRTYGIMATTATSSAAKMFINTVSWANGTTSTAVTGGQAANVNGVDVITGANSDSISSSFRYDNTHYNASGATLMSSLMLPIVQANP